LKTIEKRSSMFKFSTIVAALTNEKVV